jgi:hypothetical protein
MALLLFGGLPLKLTRADQQALRLFEFLGSLAARTQRRLQPG